MDSVVLLKFIGYFPDYLSALSRTLSKQLYTAVSTKVVHKSVRAYSTIPEDSRRNTQ